MNQHGMRVLPRSESPWGNLTPQNRTLPDLGTAKLTPMGFTRVQPTYDVRGEVENLASEECGYSSIRIYDARTTTR